VAIKSGKGRARTDDAEVNCDAAGLAEKILRGVHELAAQAGTLAPRFDSEQTQASAVAAKLDIDASCKSLGIFRQQKSPFFHVGADALGMDAVALDEGLLDAESSVD
jgi:hypothetical protein